MDAHQTSDFILNLIRKSNLNFSISESPFTVSINMKKSFIKEKDGTTRTPGLDQLSSSPQISEKGAKYFASNQQHAELWHDVPPQQPHVDLAPGDLHQQLPFQNSFTDHYQPQYVAGVHLAQIPKQPDQEISYFQSPVSPKLEAVLPHSGQHLRVPLHPIHHTPDSIKREDKFKLRARKIEKEENSEMTVENSYLDENQNEEIYSEPNIPVKNRFSCLVREVRDLTMPSTIPNSPSKTVPSNPKPLPSPIPRSASPAQASPSFTPPGSPPSSRLVPPGIPARPVTAGQQSPSFTPPGTPPRSSSTSSRFPTGTMPKLPGNGLREIDTSDDKADIESKETDAEMWMKSITEDIVKFVESGPVGNIEITIFKLEALKNLLKTDEFDELIQSAKQTKDFLEKKKEGDAEDDFEDYFVDEYPPHHYGEDGEVIID